MDNQARVEDKNKFKLAAGKVYNSLYEYEPNQQFSNVSGHYEYICRYAIRGYVAFKALRWYIFRIKSLSGGGTPTQCEFS